MHYTKDSTPIGATYTVQNTAPAAEQSVSWSHQKRILHRMRLEPGFQNTQCRTFGAGGALRSQLVIRCLYFKVEKTKLFKGALGSTITKDHGPRWVPDPSLNNTYCAIQNKSCFTSLGILGKQAWSTILTPKSFIKAP